MTEKVCPPIHPGEILLTEFLEPMGISQYRLAKDINVPLPRINEIILQRRGISADTAIRLARYFETMEQFWLNLQARYELECAKDELGDSLADDIPMVVSERLATYDTGESE